MKLTKKGQYALLFTLFLQRSGLARTQDAATALNVSQNFIEQIARHLRNAGIISVKRGPGGGYQIAANTLPTIGCVLDAVGIKGIASNSDLIANSETHGVDGETLNRILCSATDALNTAFSQTIESLAKNETLAVFNVKSGTRNLEANA